MTHLVPITPLLAEHAEIAKSLPGASYPKVSALRTAAAATYGQEGIPSPRVEAWKYTRLNGLDTGGFQPAHIPLTRPSHVPCSGVEGEVIQLVLLDGHFSAGLSSKTRVDGLTVTDLKSHLEIGDEHVVEALDRHVKSSGMPLAALASAYLNDGVVIQVADGAKIAPVIEVISLTTAGRGPKISFPRVLISVGVGASATVVESFFGDTDQAYAMSTVTDIDLGEGAHLQHYALQAQTANAIHVFGGRCDVPASANYEGFILQVGGKTSRHEMHLRMVGKGAEATLNGAYGVRGHSVCDTTTVIDHISPETNSDQVFKCILDERARGIYQGRIHIHRDAQKVNGNQLHNAMLLSRSAEVDCKPELEIYADDVKCSHGATVGELDANQVFFLRSRGIDEVTARGLLIQAFLKESLDLISHVGVRSAFVAQAEAWFKAGQEISA